MSGEWAVVRIVFLIKLRSMQPAVGLTNSPPRPYSTSDNGRYRICRDGRRALQFYLISDLTTL